MHVWNRRGKKKGRGVSISGGGVSNPLKHRPLKNKKAGVDVIINEWEGSDAPQGGEQPKTATTTPEKGLLQRKNMAGRRKGGPKKRGVRASGKPWVGKSAFFEVEKSLKGQGKDDKLE